MTRKYPSQINKEVLIDIGSTCNISRDKGFLYDIHVTKKLTVTRNGVKLLTNKRVTLHNYGEV